MMRKLRAVAVSGTQLFFFRRLAHARHPVFDLTSSICKKICNVLDLKAYMCYNMRINIEKQ